MPTYPAVPYDAQGNPLSATPNAALPTGQSTTLVSGSDYGTNAAKAQTIKVDGFGSQAVSMTNPAGGSSQVYSTQPAPALTSQYGGLVMGRQDSPAPSNFLPLNLDMLSSLNVHLKSKQTFRALANGVTCAANKSLITLVNNSTMVVRVQECSIYIPPSGGVGSGLLGSANVTYYPVICELRRVASVTGGTAVTSMSGDSADTLATGIACATAATVGTNMGTYHRQDAVVSTNTGANSWYSRGDVNEKSFVLRPGEMASITCLSSGTINNSSGSGTTTAAADLELVYTQAPA